MVNMILAQFFSGSMAWNYTKKTSNGLFYVLIWVKYGIITFADHWNLFLFTFYNKHPNFFGIGWYTTAGPPLIQPLEKNTTFTTLPHQPAQSFFQITGTDGFLQHKFMCTKVPRVVEIKIERRLTHVTFTQKTRVCIPCETNCHQAFLKPNDVNLNQINTGLVRQGGELMHGGPRAS